MTVANGVYLAGLNVQEKLVGQLTTYISGIFRSNVSILGFHDSADSHLRGLLRIRMRQTAHVAGSYCLRRL